MKRAMKGMKRVFIVACLAATAQLAVAQGTPPGEQGRDYARLVRPTTQIASLGDDLFGDKTNLFTGETTFTQVDIDLPGNNALPVRLARRSVTNDPPGGVLGGWDFDLPYLYGAFAANAGWQVSVATDYKEGSDNRCSVSITAPNLAQPPSGKGTNGVMFPSNQFWYGNSMYMPGQGTQKMMVLSPGGNRPTSGGPYHWGTADGWVFSCLPTTANGVPGQGFLAHSKDGTRYYFDWFATAYEKVVSATVGSFPAQGYGELARVGVMILPTRIEDRFGNYVVYTYDQTNRRLLKSIQSSDGRSIEVFYTGTRLASAKAAGRTWTYGYSANGLLNSVLLPDNSKWQFEFNYPLDVAGAWRNCADYSPAVAQNGMVKMIHPSGAVGEFELGYRKHGRENVPFQCFALYSTSYPYESKWLDTLSIFKKKISGPGLTSPLTWSFDYGEASGSWASECATKACPGRRVLTVTSGDGTWKRYTFSNKYNDLEGKRLSFEIGSANGVVYREDTEYQTDPAGAYPKTGVIPCVRCDKADEVPAPVKKVTIQQDGVNFQREMASFDVFARPVMIRRFSSLGSSRTTTTKYHDDVSRWVLGQIKQESDIGTGIVIAQTDFDAATNLPVRLYSFGLLREALSYNADGTLASVEDGRKNKTTFTGWKRGIPQTVRYMSGDARSAVVDDNGWIRSVTDENGFVTRYDYDGMGRNTLVDYPDGDPVNWNNTISSFLPVSVDEYGLAAGHWKQTVSTGNARSVTYFDALWRPVVKEKFDSADKNGSLSQIVTRYDMQGRPAFESYPMRGLTTFNPSSGGPTMSIGQPGYVEYNPYAPYQPAGATSYTSSGSGSMWQPDPIGGTATYDVPLLGTYTIYDGLGRVLRIEQDSELGKLATSTRYLSGFRTQVTSPRQGVTTTTYMVYDEPVTDWPVTISHPEGAFTDIARDVFGNPTLLTRRNAYATISLTRQYVYDGYKRLCKTIEPETGATVLAYDAAGNLDWSASGLNLSKPSCDTDTAYLSPSRAQRSYDVRNRLTGLAFSNGNGSQSWQYWPDGLVKQIDTSNLVDGLPTVTTNAYSYNRRRLITAESLAQAGAGTQVFGYGYDANGNLAANTYPDNLSVAYAPNALGQPTQAGLYARDVRYFPNGAMQQFTYGNGIVHTLEQGTRGLPDRSRDASGAVVVLDDSYDYDANANVAAISDARPGNRGNRDMTYDLLDRLKTANSPMYGAAAYAYDVLDNLEKVKVGNRDHTYRYDPANRLTNVKAGTSTVVGLGYDAQGNLQNKNGQTFQFDYGNRLRVGGSEIYRYDGHGRRHLATHAVKGDIHSMYDYGGTLRYQRNTREAKAYDYITLNGSLVAQVSKMAEPAFPVLSAPGWSTTGSYTVGWAAVTGATSYKLEESANGAAWASVAEGAALSKALSGRGAGRYGYRAQACNSAGCGRWSESIAVFIELPPNPPSAIAVPSLGASGQYVVTWKPPKAEPTTLLKAEGPTQYTLEERFNSGAWSVVVSNTEELSKTFSGRAAGWYGYRVKACNPIGCSSVLMGLNEVEVLYPPATPSLSVPPSSTTGTYTVSWSAIGGATSYQVDESFNAGTWTRVHDTSATSGIMSGRYAGTYGYRVAACNKAGCSAPSAVGSVVVSYPPATAPQLDGPGTSSNGTYSLNWTILPSASRYELVERFNGGSYGLIYNANGGSTSLVGRGIGNWEYMVRACNGAGCGPYSTAELVVVLAAPAPGPEPTPWPDVPANLTAKYMVMNAQPPWDTKYLFSFSPVSSATRYEVGTVWSGTGTTGEYRRIGIPTEPRFSVRACNGSGCSAWSASVAPTPR